MEYTTLGSTGITVSGLCLGTWRFTETSNGEIETTPEEAHELLDTAHNLGINFIDTANRYGDPAGRSEEILGDWLNEQDREEFVIASKVCLPVGDGVNEQGLSRKHIRRQIEASLNRLGTDYIDLYYIHRWDDKTPIEKTLSTLNTLVQDGTVHYLGASTMTAWKLMKALWKSDTNGWERFKVTQPPMDATLQNWKRYEGFNLHHYLDVCDDQNLAVCPYSPSPEDCSPASTVDMRDPQLTPALASDQRISNENISPKLHGQWLKRFRRWLMRSTHPQRR